MDQNTFWQAIQDSGWNSWGGLLAAGLLMSAIIIVVAYFIRSPLLSDRARRDEMFWLRQGANKKNGYQGVLYTEDVITTFGHWRPWNPMTWCQWYVVVPWGRKTWVAWLGGYFVRRLTVLLKHRDPSRDECVFRNEENPNWNSLDDTIRAFSTWINTARKYDVPAVYRAGKELHTLTAEEILKMEADPVAFVAKFQKRVAAGRPVI